MKDLLKRLNRQYTIYQSTDMDGKNVWWWEDGSERHFCRWRFVSHQVMSKKANLVKLP